MWANTRSFQDAQASLHSTATFAIRKQMAIEHHTRFHHTKAKSNINITTTRKTGEPDSKPTRENSEQIDKFTLLLQVRFTEKKKSDLFAHSSLNHCLHCRCKHIFIFSFRFFKLLVCNLPRGGVSPGIHQNRLVSSLRLIT